MKEQSLHLIRKAVLTESKIIVPQQGRPFFPSSKSQGKVGLHQVVLGAQGCSGVAFTRVVEDGFSISPLCMRELEKAWLGSLVYILLTRHGDIPYCKERWEV